MLNFFVNAQVISIPDPVFKNKLLQASPSNITASNAFGDTIKIDTNDDGEIEVSEALVVDRLVLYGSNINDLTGIEYFTNVTYMNCGGNNLTFFNFNTLNNLEVLNLFNNQLTTLNLNGLSSLKDLSCNNNQITSLDFSQNPVLKEVYCANNQIAVLDFTNNPLFDDLGCKDNSNLTTIKIKNGAMQLFGSQTVGNQCWSGLPNLTTICADDAEIPALQNFMTSCGINISSIDINSDCVLGIESHDWKANIVMSPNPSEGVFIIQNLEHVGSTFEVEVYTVLGNTILAKKFDKNITNTLDLSNFPSGIYFAKIKDSSQSLVIKLIKK